MVDFDSFIGHVRFNSAAGRFLAWAKDQWNVELEQLVSPNDASVLKHKGHHNPDFIEHCVGILAAAIVKKVLTADPTCVLLRSWRLPLIDNRTETVSGHEPGFNQAYVTGIVSRGVSAEQLDYAKLAYMAMVKNAEPEPFSEDDLPMLDEWHQVKRQVLLSQDNRAGAW